MGENFVKVYGTILDSSIWLEPAPTRLLWITMLAMADENGIVRASVGGLAHRARISRDDCEAGLATLMAPDPDSRSEEFEGRRVDLYDGGWMVLNHRRYRDMRTEAQQDAAKRAADYRERRKSRDGRDASRSSRTEAEAEGDPEAEKEGEVLGGERQVDLLPPPVEIWIPIVGASEVSKPKKTDRFGAPHRVVVPDQLPEGERWANGGVAVREYGITLALVAEIMAAFPSIDVRAELRGLVQWSRGDAKRRRTYQRMASWLTSCIGSKQDRQKGGASGGATKAAPGMLCNRCEGTGYVMVPNKLGHTEFNTQTGQMEAKKFRDQCGRCQGTGRY